MNLLKNLTLFSFLGILSILSGLIFSLTLFASNSVQDRLVGIYILMGLIPVVVVVFIDIYFVKKFGNIKVNKVEFSIVLFIILLWIIRAITNL